MSHLNWLVSAAAAAVALVVGIGVGFQWRKLAAEARVGSAEAQAARIIGEANRDGEARKRESLVAIKEETLRMRNEVEREAKERRNELLRTERRLTQKEESLDRKSESLEKREEGLRRRDQDLVQLEKAAADLHTQQVAELERVSGLTSADAKELLLCNVEQEIRVEAAQLARDIEQAARENADRKAREVIALAIQRSAADHAAEATVSVVALPNDEMKGRIIGREGRNIRTLETLTGIDLIIDDTPEAVILSGFDPIRREVARISLERLIADGRIHPARIEETVEKAQKEVEARIQAEGEQATFDAGVHNLHPELIKLLGRLKFRSSYGQNVLKHSLEVAHLAAVMASELGANVQIARRAGLIHDIGKAVDHEVEGTHVAIGVDLARKFREGPEVIEAVAAHHGDAEFGSVEAVLVAAADAISASRPGARRETLESYIKRLEKLEAIADTFEGVDKAYAIQAGREVRIIVKPDRVDDLSSVRLARDIVKKIESELDYPGQIKVTVIRETRAVEYAK
ncbi:MAG: ribonuclease Y [Bacillota bacterium]|nr:ribonuclease Y [Bacillota bacterium]